VREIVRNAPQTLLPTHNLELDLGLDSMQRVEVLSRIEEQKGGNVEESQLAEIYTLRDLIDAILHSAENVGTAPGARTAFAGWKTILDEEPDDPDVVALGQPRPMSEAFWYAVFQLAQVAARDLFSLRVYGLENLPDTGPFILSSNHQSYVDPIVLASVLPGYIFRNCFAVGTSEIFGEGSMRRLAQWLRVVVVDPDANLVPAMRAGAYGLRRGRVLLLYPEGERSVDGAPKTFKKGAAILSIHIQVPIVPVAIDGFFEAWPRGKKFFQKMVPLKIRFGKPILPPSMETASDTVYEQMTADLKASVMEMWQQLRTTKAR
jgi:long-chain acyl-CoA synthetase